MLRKCFGLMLIALGASSLTWSLLGGALEKRTFGESLTMTEMTSLRGLSDYFGVYAGASCSNANNGGDCSTTESFDCSTCDYNYPSTYPVFGIGSGFNPVQGSNTCGFKHIGGTCVCDGDPAECCLLTIEPIPPQTCTQSNAVYQSPPGGTG